MAKVCRIPSAIVGQLDEHEGDRELEREMRDAGVDLEAEAEAGPTRAPAVHAPTVRLDREGLRREAGVATPTSAPSGARGPFAADRSKTVLTRRGGMLPHNGPYAPQLAAFPSS